MTKEKTKVTWSGEYDSIGQKIPEIKVKPKYKVIRWSDDGTEEIWEAPQKPTFQEMYKLINCTTNERATNAWITWMARTGHRSMHDDFIAGHVVIYKKI